MVGHDHAGRVHQSSHEWISHGILDVAGHAPNLAHLLPCARATRDPSTISHRRSARSTLRRADHTTHRVGRHKGWDPSLQHALRKLRPQPRQQMRPTPPIPSRAPSSMAKASLKGRESRPRHLVCLGPRYGIFHVAEFAVLAGLHITTLAPMLGSPHDILAC